MSKPLIEVQGMPELIAKLKLIGDDKAKKGPIIRVLRQVAQGTVRVARLLVPVSKKAHWQGGKRTKLKIQPGNLKRSIQPIVAKRAKEPTVVAGPKAGGKNDGFYGAMVSEGHNIYHTGFKRKRSASAKALLHNSAGATSRTKATPFMKQAYDQTKGQVTQETEQKVIKFIDKEIKKLGN